MTAAAFVDGVLLAAIIATWIWTWWWNRYVVLQHPEPDYEAAMRVLTLMLMDTPRPLLARRAQITKAVVDVSTRVLGRELTVAEINAFTIAYVSAEYEAATIMYREGKK